MTDVPHNFSTHVGTAQSYNVPPEEISASEISKIEQKFWATDTQSPYQSTYKLDASEMQALVPERPVMPKPTEDSVTPPLWQNQETSQKLFEPKFTESSFPDLMQDEQNELIYQLGKEQGLSDEQIVHRQYYNNHRELAEAQDPAIAELLATVDETALKNLKKDFPQTVPKNPKDHIKQNTSDKTDSELYGAQFEKQIERFSDDEKTAYRYAFYYGDKATPKMQEKVKPMRNEALAATQKEAGIPPGTAPPLDTYPIDDELSFHFKQEYNKGLNDAGFNKEEKQRAEFLTYHKEFINQIEPQERAPFLAVKEANTRLTGDIEKNMKERFQLPEEFALSDLHRSSYDAALSEEFLHESIKKVNTFAENPVDPSTGESMPPLTSQQLGQIQYAMIRPGDPAVDPKLNEIAAHLSAQTIPNVQAQYSLPSNFVPPLGLLDPSWVLSPSSIHIHNLIATAESDLETMYTLGQQEPASPEQSMFIDWLKRISQALSDMKQSLFTLQADDSDKAKEFSLMNGQSRVELLDAEQARMEEARRKAKKKHGPLTFVTKNFYRYTVGEILIRTGVEDKKSINRTLNKSLVVHAALDKHIIMPALDVVGSVFEGLTYVIEKATEATKFLLMNSLATQMLLEIPGVDKNVFKQVMEVVAMVIVMAAMAAAIVLLPGVGLAMAAQLAFSFVGPMIITNILVAAGVPETYAMIAAIVVTIVGIGAYNIHATRTAATAAAAAPPSGATSGVRVATTAPPPIPPPTPPPAPASTATTRIGRAAERVQTWGRDKINALKTWNKELVEKSKHLDEANASLNTAQTNLKTAQTKYDAVKKAGDDLTQVADDLARAKKDLLKAQKEAIAPQEAFDTHTKSFYSAVGKVYAVSNIQTASAEAYKLKVRAEQVKVLGKMDEFIEQLRILINMLSETIARMYSDMSSESSFGHRAANIQGQLDELWKGLSNAGSRLHHAQA